MLDTEWMADAACKGQDTDIWFTSPPTRRAVETCRRCPVALACFTYAKATGSCGVWGGRMMHAPTVSRFHDSEQAKETALNLLRRGMDPNDVAEMIGQRARRVQGLARVLKRYPDGMMCAGCRKLFHPWETKDQERMFCTAGCASQNRLTRTPPEPVNTGRHR